jgi:hypothetical protein
MNPEKGQHVKCVMRSSLVLEGIIEEWSETQVVLRSLEDQSLMIIHHPAEDIMLTKVLQIAEAQPAPIENPSIAVPAVEPIQEQVKKKLHEVLQPIDDAELQKKSIQELRQLVIERERQIITNKKREHFGSAGTAKMTRYSSPYMPSTIPRSNSGIVNEHDNSPYKPRKIPRG